MFLRRPILNTRIRRRLLALAVLAAGAAPLLISLYGCASVDLLAAGGSQEWDPLPTRSPAKVVTPVHISDPEELRSRCHYRGSMLLWGCAVFVTDELCVIYHAQPVMSADVEKHERKHCAGYSHYVRR